MASIESVHRPLINFGDNIPQDIYVDVSNVYSSMKHNLGIFIRSFEDGKLLNRRIAFGSKVTQETQTNCIDFLKEEKNISYEFQEQIKRLKTIQIEHNTYFNTKDNSLKNKSLKSIDIKINHLNIQYKLLICCIRKKEALYSYFYIKKFYRILI